MFLTLAGSQRDAKALSVVVENGPIYKITLHIPFSDESEESPSSSHAAASGFAGAGRGSVSAELSDLDKIKQRTVIMKVLWKYMVEISPKTIEKLKLIKRNYFEKARNHRVEILDREVFWSEALELYQNPLGLHLEKNGLRASGIRLSFEKIGDPRFTLPELPIHLGFVLWLANFKSDRLESLLALEGQFGMGGSEEAAELLWTIFIIKMQSLMSLASENSGSGSCLDPTRLAHAEPGVVTNLNTALNAALMGLPHRHKLIFLSALYGNEDVLKFILTTVPKSDPALSLQDVVSAAIISGKLGTLKILIETDYRSPTLKVF